MTAGLCSAIPIYALAPPDEDDPLDAYRHTKSYELGVERVGGKAALIGSQISDAIASLFHGATLGITIGVLSITICDLPLSNAQACLERTAPLMAIACSR